MNVALDTNIIVYSLAGTAQLTQAATRALEDAAKHGGVFVISGAVYAELLAMPNSTVAVVDEFVKEANIRVDWGISKRSWIAAGLAFAAYSRRRRQKSDAPRRLLADFIIGSHAIEVGALLTADSSFYRTSFPELRLFSL